jgi:hypothetical protein
MIRYSIPLAAAILACSLQAQNPMSDDLRTRYDFIKTNILKAADKVPADIYDFKPTPEIRNFGQLIGHTADVQEFFCSAAAGERKNLGAGRMTTKADLVAALKASFETCDPLYAGITDATASKMVPSMGGMTPLLNVLYYNVTHDNEMYGVMGVYMRLKNIVPPSSETPPGGRGGGRGRGKGKGKANTQP